MFELSSASSYDIISSFQNRTIQESWVASFVLTLFQKTKVRHGKNNFMHKHMFKKLRLTSLYFNF